MLERTNGLCRTASVRPSLPPVGLSLCRVPLLQALRGARDVAEAGASYATGARAEVAPWGGRPPRTYWPRRGLRERRAKVAPCDGCERRFVGDFSLFPISCSYSEKGTQWEKASRHYIYYAKHFLVDISGMWHFVAKLSCFSKKKTRIEWKHVKNMCYSRISIFFQTMKFSNLLDLSWDSHSYEMSNLNKSWKNK